MGTGLRELVSGLLEFLEHNRELKSMDSAVQEILDRALDKVVAGTDSKISLVSGYKRKLHKPIIKSLQYADSVVEQIPPPISLNSEKVVDNPYLRAFFHTPKGLKRVCNKSSELREFFQEPGRRQFPAVCALLCMRKQEESVLGMQLEGDQVIKDVMQTRVTFTNHRIQSPAVDEMTARRELKCCIFTGLVDNALANISALRARRRQLEVEQRVLGSRVRSLSDGVERMQDPGNTMNDGSSLREVETRLEQVEEELTQIGYVTPEASLEQVNSILDNPQNFVSIKNISMKLDKENILRLEEECQRSISRLDMSEVSVKGQPPRVVTLAMVEQDELVSPDMSFPRVI